MAFAQQHRRPRHRSPPLDASIDDDELVTRRIPTIENHLLSAGQPHSHTLTTSDSDTDWHDISSAIRSSSSDSTSSFSDVLPPPPPTATTSSSSILSIDRRDSLSMGTSESYSSVRPSDTESFSDIDFAFGALPSHDGTGAFVEQDEVDTEDETTRHLEQALVSTASDFEPASPSMPNILLPYGGIHLPSFVSHATLDQRVLPQFQPTVVLKDVMVSSDEQLSIPLSRQNGDDGVTDESSADQLRFTRRRPRNLDRIPSHHPSFPGAITSFAILSMIWNNLRRLTNHLIENDTYTADAFTTLVSEATLEGCLPFGSHLHMELAAGLRPDYTNRRYEGLPGM